MGKRDQRNINFGKTWADREAYKVVVELEQAKIGLADLVKAMLLQLREGSLQLAYDPIRLNTQQASHDQVLNLIKEIHAAISTGTIPRPASPTAAPEEGQRKLNQKVAQAIAAFED